MALSCCQKLPALLRGITSTHEGDFYCLNCFHSFRTENKLKKYKNVCEDHDYCYVEMPKEDNEILKYKHGEKSRLAWQACLKKTEVNLEFLTNVDMLLMVEKRIRAGLIVEKGIRGGICHAIHRYARVNNKYMKNYDKNKESSCIQYLDANNLYG